MTLNFPACRATLTGWLPALLLALLLAGCATTDPQLPAPGQARVTISEDRTPHADPEIEAQLVRLDAARILTQQQRHQESLDLLQSLQPQLLPAEYQWSALQAAATSGLALDDGWITLRMIDRFSQRLPQLDRQQEYQLAGFRADAFLLTGFYASALQQRHNQSLLAINPEQRASAYQQLWLNLNQIGSDQLQSLRQQERQPLLQGWMDLALVRQVAATHPEQLNASLNRWRQEWPQHPANQHLPDEMATLVLLSKQHIEHIGVFLPESGPLAEAAAAIRDALLTRHLSSVREGKAVPRISFYDAQGSNLDDFYRQAQADGVQVVIGPLAKAQVDLLERRRNLPLPTLALNYGNDEQFPTSNLFQFGLSAENEAEQAALKAWQFGFRRALILTPESNWGNRVESSFIRSWQDLGGEVSYKRQFGGSLTLDNALRQLLEVQLSQQRHQRLTRLLGQRPHFVPRPREDSDFLFIHATPADARQIKPALNFLTASGLPVLATSSIYSGTRNPSLDRDMNGIAFSDIPWYLGAEDPLEQEIRQTWPDRMTRYGRLYAMGADAYLLAQRLPLLEALPDSRIDGATGRLSQQQRRIHRELQWAEFVSGRPQPLNPDAFGQQPLVEQILPD